MDGNRRGGWQVCVDTADFIKSMVREGQKEDGYLSEYLVALLRKEAMEDSQFHNTFDRHYQFGGGPAAKPKR